ncbi:MAG: hypothetical protein SGPRY_005865, partial [Prymnesium sp.]
MEACPHGLPRQSCARCRRKQKSCAHAKRKTRCRLCGGGSLCVHARRRDSCRPCLEASRNGSNKMLWLNRLNLMLEGREDTGGRVAFDRSTQQGSEALGGECDSFDWKETLGQCMVLPVVPSSRLTEDGSSAKRALIAFPMSSAHDPFNSSALMMQTGGRRLPTHGVRNSDGMAFRIVTSRN